MPMHPHFKAFLSAVSERLEKGMTMGQAFQELSMSEAAYELPEGLETQDFSIDGRHGAIKVRLYRPGNLTTNAPALVWFHGGGFVMGSIDQKEAHVVSAEVAQRANCLVMSVDYRLVTKDIKFPVPLEDGFDATQWLFENSAALGVDARKIIVGGASAGGSLAATVCLKAAEAGLPVLGAVLAYPLAHLTLPKISAELAEKVSELPAGMVMGEDYVRNRNAFLMPVGELPENHFGWPAEEKDLSGFPQALVIESEYDAIRASSEQFIRDLRAQGVVVESFLAEGMTHGFLNNTAAEVDAVELSHNKIVEFIRAITN